MIDGIGGGLGANFYTSSRATINRASQHLSDSLRINPASSDAGKQATVDRFLAVESASIRGATNLRDGQDLIRVADRGLSKTSEVLTRMRKLAVEGQQSDLTSAQKDAIRDAFTKLEDEVSQIANSTESAGNSLLDGSKTGADALVFADGNGGRLKLSIDGANSNDLGLDVVDPTDNTAIDAVDAASNQVSKARSKLSESFFQLSNRLRTVAVATSAVASSGAQIRDLDYAFNTASKTRGQILKDSSLALDAKGTQLSGKTLLTLD